MTNSLSLEINGIDPVTVAAVDLIIQTLPSTRMRLVDSRRLSAELARLFPDEHPFPRRSQAMRAHLEQRYPDLRYCNSYSPVDLAIVSSQGAHNLEQSDSFMLEDIPHILSCQSESWWDIGPLVIPGLTCCARCIDSSSEERSPSKGRGIALWRLEAPLAWLTHMAASWLSLMIYDFARFGCEHSTCTDRFLRISASGDVSWHELSINPDCGCHCAASKHEARVSEPICEVPSPTGLHCLASLPRTEFDLLSHNLRYPLAS